MRPPRVRWRGGLSLQHGFFRHPAEHPQEQGVHREHKDQGPENLPSGQAEHGSQLPPPGQQAGGDAHPVDERQRREGAQQAAHQVLAQHILGQGAGPHADEAQPHRHGSVGVEVGRVAQDAHEQAEARPRRGALQHRHAHGSQGQEHRGHPKEGKAVEHKQLQEPYGHQSQGVYAPFNEKILSGHRRFPPFRPRPIYSLTVKSVITKTCWRPSRSVSGAMTA